jgi:pimeloyl-ACP methyl ester carboxylesterase
MHFSHEGSGAPPLVFVHGFCCEHGDWRPQTEALKKTFEIVACDLRGHGATPGRPEECSIENFGGDVAALLALLDLRKCILVGHSMGCRVVLEAARLASDRVAGLVLIDGSKLGGASADEGEALARAAIDKAGYSAFSEALFRQMFVPGSANAAAILARVAGRAPDIGMALWPRMGRWDAGQMDAALGALAAPLLAIQSTTRDPATLRRTPLRAGESSPWLDYLKGRFPAARVEVIPDVGHFTGLDAPERVNALISEFAAGCR